MHRVSAQFGKFAIAGFAGLVVNLLLTYLLTTYAHLWYFWSFLIGALAAWTVSFFLNALLTFPGVSVSPQVWLSRYSTFISGYLGIGSISAALVFILTSKIGLPYLLSIILTTAVTTASTFAYTRSQVFVHHERRHSTIRTISYHFMGIILALLIGALCVSPFVFSAMQPSSAGIAMFGPDAQEHYLARIHEAQLGNLTLGNVFLQEKTVPYLIPGLGEDVIGNIARLFSLPPTSTLLWSIFLTATIAALLMYALAYMCTKSRVAGILASSSLLGIELMSGFSTWHALLIGSSSVTSFINYSRLINPAGADIFLFAGLVLIYHIAFSQKKTAWWQSILLGLLTGTSLYYSFYIASFLFVLMGLIWLWCLIRHDIRCTVHLASATLIGVLISTPFILHQYFLTKLPDYHDAALRTGIVISHVPVISLWLGILGILGIFFWPHRFKNVRPLVLFSTLTLALLSEQQVITGHALQFSHYHWYITKPLIGLVMALYAVYFAERFLSQRVYRFALYALAVAVCFYSAALIQINSYKFNLAATISSQSYVPVFSFLNALPNKQGTVFTDRTMSLYLPIYTDYSAPNNSYVEYYLVPQQFLVARLFIEYKMRGIIPANALSTMQKERSDISQRIFGIYYRDQFGDYSDIPDSVLQQYATMYAKEYATPLSQDFKKLGVTLIVAQSGSPESSLLMKDSFKSIGTTGQFAIYQVQ